MTRGLQSKGGDQPSELCKACAGLPIPGVRPGRARPNPFGENHRQATVTNRQSLYET